ncbi:hypothetical protein C8J57DRAFT_1525259 [Mycena rebaudengoi]|nr:hypothetical protein C8J57DRAFT_1525259 [Mycena rebaudengoi]
MRCCMLTASLVSTNSRLYTSRFYNSFLTLISPYFYTHADTVKHADPEKQGLCPPADAQLAPEEFLRAAKGMLAASEIARIRDQVGVTGMGGF